MQLEEPTTTRRRGRRRVHLAAPVAAAAVLVAAWGHELSTAAAVGVAVVLAAAIMSGVHHAEAVARRVGEPMGSLVLAIAVTVIEVGLIVTMMASGGAETDTLARDTVFAAVMLTMNGIIGISLLVGAVRYGLAQFNAEGSGAALSTVLTLATVCLILPTFTTSAHGSQYTASQLTFAGLTSIALYALFVTTQTGRHREFFVPAGEGEGEGGGEDTDADPEPQPEPHGMTMSVALLVLALTAVVGLAKVEAKPIEHAVTSVGLPESFVGVVIAMVILAPETLAAVRNAAKNRIQISCNLAYGSAMASVGLTIPAVGLAAAWLDRSLVLGLGTTQITLLVLTAVVSMLTIIPGRATRLHGALHLVVAGVFVFLAINP